MARIIRQTSIYLYLFYTLMLVSLSLLVVYEFNYGKLDDSLEQEALGKENITLSYLQSSIKKENSLLNSIYANINDNEFNKASVDSIFNNPDLINHSTRF